jgi:hypothetical protein
MSSLPTTPSPSLPPSASPVAVPPPRIQPYDTHVLLPQSTPPSTQIWFKIIDPLVDAYQQLDADKGRADRPFGDGGGKDGDQEVPD